MKSEIENMKSKKKNLKSKNLKYDKNNQIDIIELYNVVKFKWTQSLKNYHVKFCNIVNQGFLQVLH
jgi:hypothetical protein